MNFFTKPAAALLAAALIFGAAGCSPAAPQNGGSGNAAQPSQPEALSGDSARFAEFTNACFLRDVVSDGVSLHFALVDPSSYGITEKPNLGDYSMEMVLDYEQQVRDDLKTIESIDRTQLTPDQQINYDVIETMLRLEMTSEGMGLFINYSSSQDGILAGTPQVLAEYRFDDQGDIDDYLALLADLPRCYQDVIVFEQLRAEEGLFMPEPALDETLRIGKEFLASAEEHYLLSSFDERLETVVDLSDADKETYREKNRSIWIDQVVPAGQIYLDELEKLRPSCRPDGGLIEVEGGKEYYSYLLKATTGTDSSPEELIEMIDNRIYETMGIMMRAPVADPDFNKNYEAYLENDYAELGTPEEMLQKLRIDSQEEFPELGDVQWQIKEVPPSMQESSAPAFYLRPPLDAPTKNVIYYNTKYESQTVGKALFNTLAHEGYPGHLYQINYFVKQNTDPYRYLLGCKGYSEGFATYVARNSYQWMGIESTVLQEVLKANDSMNMLLTARMDIGVNYEGWGKEEMFNYLGSFGLADQEIVDSIYLIALDDPANALPYIIGAQMFLTIRKDAEQKLGSRFDAKEFHKVILNCGISQFSVVQKQVDAYIASQLPTPQAAASQQASSEQSTVQKAA